MKEKRLSTVIQVNHNLTVKQPKNKKRLSSSFHQQILEKKKERLF